MGSQNFRITQETNGAVQKVSNILKYVMVSATEEEVGAFFHNIQGEEPIYNTLNSTGNPQLLTSMQIEHSTGNGIENNTVHQKQ